jgi:VIT1/CCC1 family predicted Fe2+/Mn2+ transporter
VSDRPRVLEPMERLSEIVFGLIMVLTFTCSFSAATSGRAEVREMLMGAIGCNLAWGIIDALIYLMEALGMRGQSRLSLQRVRLAEAAEGRRVIADALPATVASNLREDELESIRKRLAALPEPAERPGLRTEDWKGALGVFLVVFLSTFPVILPFFLIRDAVPALRFSNAIALFLLLYAGYRLGKYSGRSPWGTALAMAAIGIVVVAATIALGG